MTFRDLGQHCIKRYSLYCFLCVTGIVFLLSGCSYKKNNTEASMESSEGAQDKGDGYRDMLERARNRKAYQHSLQQVKDAVKAFQIDLGRLPTNLLEMVRFRYIESFPEQVPPGYTWGYDAVYGRVSFIKIPEEQQGQSGAAKQE